jgi:transcriptional regulator with XRE-family HTH domain
MTAPPLDPDATSAATARTIPTHLIQRALTLVSTREALAVRLNVSMGHVSRALNGQAGFSVEKCLRLADLLEEPPAAVLRNYGHIELSESRYFQQAVTTPNASHPLDPAQAQAICVRLLDHASTCAAVARVVRRCAGDARHSPLVNGLVRLLQEDAHDFSRTADELAALREAPPKSDVPPLGVLQG